MTSYKGITVQICRRRLAQNSRPPPQMHLCGGAFFVEEFAALDDAAKKTVRIDKNTLILTISLVCFDLELPGGEDHKFYRLIRMLDSFRFIKSSLSNIERDKEFQKNLEAMKTEKRCMDAMNAEKPVRAAVLAAL
ncbi:MAG: hypothetical protein LUC21_06680 [Oscillospiraceae bacterium]|nr:hypothetical protein [Oscillospiraceae bacterium]